MKVYAKANKSTSVGFAHPILMLVLACIALVVTFFVYKAYKERPYEYSEIQSEAVAGISTPNSQIAYIPKAECDLYVATNGNDSNSGDSENSPLKKIQTGANKAQAGQAVCIKGGEYREVVEIYNKHGTPQNPIVIGGYAGGGLPIVSGGITNGDEYMLPDAQCRIKDVCNSDVLDSGKCTNRDNCIRRFLFNVLESSNIHIYGIDVRGSSGRGFGVSESNDVYVRGVRTYHNWSQGFQFNADMPGKGNNMFAEYIAVYDNIRAMAEKNLIGGGAIHVNKIKGGYIRNSLVFENFGEGLDVHKGTTNFVVAKNMLWDNFHASLYANGSTNATLDSNLLFCTKNRVNWLEENGVKPGKDTGYGSALTLRNEEIVTSQHGEGGGTIASNNLLVGCTGNILIAAQGDAKLDDVAVFNNTIVSPRDFPAVKNKYDGKSGEGISISGKAGALQNIHIENNVILADSTGDSIIGGAMGSDQITYINNLVSKPPLISKAGIRVADPKIKKNVGEDEVLNPAHINAADYMITNASPAVNAGAKPAVSRNLLDRDFFGNIRGNNPIDLGAYETGMTANWSNLYNVIMQGASSGLEGAGDDEDPPEPAKDPDKDGVPNDGTDKCPEVNQGSNPDPSKPGCPLEYGVKVSNKLKNSSFEEEASPATDELAKYWMSEKTFAGQVRYSLRNANITDFSSGNAVLIEVVKIPINQPKISQSDIILMPNTAYKVSFSAKSSGTNSRVTIELIEMGTMQKLVAPRRSVRLTPAWTSYDFDLRTKNFDPTKKVKLNVKFAAPKNSNIVIDNVELKK